jgi:hypothetical protein
LTKLASEELFLAVFGERRGESDDCIDVIHDVDNSPSKRAVVSTFAWHTPRALKKKKKEKKKTF